MAHPFTSRKARDKHWAARKKARDETKALINKLLEEGLDNDAIAAASGMSVRTIIRRRQDRSKELES